MTSRAKGQGGLRYCDDAYMHVTSAARLDQRVVDDSASLQEIISTYQHFDILCIAYCCNVSNHTKNARCV